MNESKKEVVLIREGGLVASIISDSYTFGMLVGSVWFNQKYCGESYFLNAVILVMFMIFLAGRISEKKRVFTSIDVAVEHLNSLRTAAKD